MSFKNTKQDLIFQAEMLHPLNGLKEHVWSLQTAPKIKVFLWKSLCEAIPIAYRIIARGMSIDSRCQVCGLEGETVNHVLFSCTLVRQVWAMTNYPQPIDAFHQSSAFVNFQYLLLDLKIFYIPLEIRRSFSCILWFI